MPRYLRKTNTLLHKAALLAKKRGLNHLEFTFADLGRLYRQWGDRATPARFLKLITPSS